MKENKSSAVNRIIDYSKALDTACMKCGPQHKPDCPIGRTKAGYSTSSDVLSEFYQGKLFRRI